MRIAPPPGLFTGIEAAHGPLRRIFTRARRLGLHLVLLRLRLAVAPGGPRGRSAVELFLPRLGAEMRSTDIAWRGPQPNEWLVLLEATADASAAVLRWQLAAQQWGLQLHAQPIEFRSGGLTLAALFAALQPANLGAEAPTAIRAASGDADGG